jgi:hypothetical protein
VAVIFGPVDHKSFQQPDKAPHDDSVPERVPAQRHWPTSPVVAVFLNQEANRDDNVNDGAHIHMEAAESRTVKIVANDVDC